MRCKARINGERRLPACSRRQPADDTQKRYKNALHRTFIETFRQAAEKNRLAACVPQKSNARAIGFLPHQLDHSLACCREVPKSFVAYSRNFSSSIVMFPNFPP